MDKRRLFKNKLFLITLLASLVLLASSVLVSKIGLINTAYAGHKCPTTNIFCGGDGNVWQDTCDADGNEGHTQKQDCQGRGCEGGACKGAAPGGGSDGCPSGQYKNAQGQCVNKVGPAADGPGGCCTPGAAEDSAEGCRSNEVCDIDNGSCASNKSCRSKPGSGCGIDSDCGPGNRCDGGTCKPGAATGQCQSANSLEVRFQLPNTAWVSTLDVPAGGQVNVGVFRSGTGVFAGSAVNGVPIRDTINASISGPNFSQGLNVSGINTITPAQAGTYTVQASCGNNVTGTGSMTVKAAANDTSGPATACNGNVAFQGNASRYNSWNGQCEGALQKSQSGGIGQGCCELACGAVAQCDEQRAGQGNCDASCRSILYAIGGKIVDAAGQPKQGVRVKVFYNIPNGVQGNEIEASPTGADGEFSVDNVLKTGYGYAVRIIVPQTGISDLSQVKTTSSGWTFRHTNDSRSGDNPLNSQSYEFQIAGNNDCSGPAGSNPQDTLRCNFKIETASANTQTIGGTVKDEQGRGVQGIKIWVSDPTSSDGYRGGKFKAAATIADGTYSVTVPKSNYWVRLPGQPASELDSRTEGEDNLRIMQAGSGRGRYEFQPAGAGCGKTNGCDFTITRLTSSPTASPTSSPTASSCSETGDFDKSGTVDDEDYNFWKAVFLELEDRSIWDTKCSGLEPDLEAFNAWRTKRFAR